MKKWLSVSLAFLILYALTVEAVYSKSTAISPAAEVLGVSHGAHLRPALEYGQEIIDFNDLVGKDIAVAMYFNDFSNKDSNSDAFFDFYLLKKIQEKMGNDGPAIMVTLLPINGRKTLNGKPACDKDYDGVIPPDDLIAGKCDPYIIGLAQALKSRPERFLLRFAHEMNIADSAWWPGHFGAKADKFVEMWQHVYQVFASQQASNVEWVWSPNYASHPPETWNDIQNYYPGNGYVDWIGLSGYNWYTAGGQPWDTFDELYQDVLLDLACRYPKPQILAEIGTVEGSPTKAGWILDAYEEIPQHPFVRLITWFNDYAYADNTEADFRVTTGTTDFGSVKPLPLNAGDWTDAYSQAVSNSIYKSHLPALNTVTPPRAYCGEEIPDFEIIPSTALIEPGQNTGHVLSGMLFADDQSPALDLGPNSYFKGSTITPDLLKAPWGEATIQIKTSPSTPLGDHTIYVEVNSKKIPLQVRVLENVDRQYLPVIQE